MKKYLRLFPLFLLFTACSSEETEEKSSGAPPSITVDVVALKESTEVKTITIPGTVIPNEEVQVFSEVSGRIQAILFKEGQKIQKGTVLLRVDSDILNAQKAQLAVELNLAKKDEARKKSLFQAKGISLEEYERSAAQLAETQAKMDLISVQISKSIIRAPFSGRIGLRHVSEGAFVTPSTLITSIIQENPIKIEFAVPERYASSVRTGQQISFKEDNQTETLSATVYAFEPRISDATRMMMVRASLQNTKGLVAGAFVSISYDLGTVANAYMVPSESIVPILKGQKILVVRAGKIVEIPVELGLRTPEKVQVLGELASGDLVLVSGLLAARPGMSVKTNLIQR